MSSTKAITNISVPHLVDPYGRTGGPIPVSAYTFENGSLKDIVGSNNGTQNGSLDFVKDRFGSGVRFDNNGYLSFGSGFSSQTNWFVSFWYTHQPVGSTVTLFSQNGGGRFYGASVSPTNVLSFREHTTIRYSTNLIPGNNYQITYGVNSSKLCKVWVNGIGLDNDEYVASTFDSVEGNMYFGLQFFTAAIPTGTISNVEIYNTDLTDSEVLAIYNRGKRIKSFFDRGLIASGKTFTSGFIENSGIEVKAGSAKIISDGTSKHIGPVTNLDLAIPVSLFNVNPKQAAYGTWHIPLNRYRLTSSMLINFIASKDTWSDSANNGYVIYQTSTGSWILARLTNGSVATSTTYTGDSSVSVDYQILITRDYSGQIKVYFKGGNFNTYTNVLTLNDNTHSVSNYFNAKLIVFNSNNYDKIYLNSSNPDYNFFYSPLVIEPS